MGKIKLPKPDLLNKQEDLKNIKNGFINKKKAPKYKNTPGGKITLISNAKQQSRKKERNIVFEPSVVKEKKVFLQDSSINNNHNISSKKEHVNQKIKQCDKTANNSTKLHKKVNKQSKCKTQVVNQAADTLDSAEDDSDFSTSDDERLSDQSVTEGKIKKNKGVEMFRGIKSKTKMFVKTREVSSDNSALENEDKTNKWLSQDASIEDKESQTSNSSEDDINESLNTTLASKASNEQEDKKEGKVNEDEDDDDNSDYDDEDEDDDDDDDDDDGSSGDSDIDEVNSSELGLKALLGSTIADDESDEDFDDANEDNDDEDDEDEDMSIDDEEEDFATESDAENTIDKEACSNKGNKQQNAPVPSKDDNEKSSSKDKAEIEKRTIFVGNIPKDTQKVAIKRVFSKFGPIQSIRIRGIVPENKKIPLKVAAIKKQIHPKLNNVIAYIEYKTEESAKKALSMNGKLFEGNYLTVDSVAKDDKIKVDPKKAVFLGNLPFNVDNNSIWKQFSACGEISSVRIIKKKNTGVGIGIGYVNFKTEDAAQLALELNGTSLGNREVRVMPYTYSQNQSSKGVKRSFTSEQKKVTGIKKEKHEADNVARATHNSINAEKRKNMKLKKSESTRSPGEKNTAATFQGQKGVIKSKHKGQKFDKKKKTIAKKLTVKPKMHKKSNS